MDIRVPATERHLVFYFFTFLHFSFSPFFLFRRVARTFLLVVYLIVAGTFVIS